MTSFIYKCTICEEFEIIRNCTACKGNPSCVRCLVECKECLNEFCKYCIFITEKENNKIQCINHEIGAIQSRIHFNPHRDLVRYKKMMLDK